MNNRESDRGREDQNSITKIITSDQLGQKPLLQKHLPDGPNTRKSRAEGIRNKKKKVASVSHLTPQCTEHFKRSLKGWRTRG